jgi:anaerobic C4-dicarboxylate transporter
MVWSVAVVDYDVIIIKILAVTCDISTTEQSGGLEQISNLIDERCK